MYKRFAIDNSVYKIAFCILMRHCHTTCYAGLEVKARSPSLRALTLRPSTDEERGVI
jgi:hypothetical protein